jgi:hypothetical protein
MIVSDIVFQLGKFISSSNSNTEGSLWNKFLPSVITVAFGLFIYYLKKWHDKSKEDTIKEKERDNDLRYFDTVVRDILNDVPKQIEAYEKYAEAVKKEPYNSHQLGAVIIENLNRILNKFDQQKIFKSYISQFGENETNEAVTKFMELYKSLDIYLKLYNDAITINMMVNNELNNRLNVDYINMFRSSIMPKFDKFYDEVSASTNSQMLSFIEEIKTEYNNLTDRIPTISQEFFINKLISEYQKIRIYPSGKTLLFDCQIISSIYTNAINNSIFQAGKILELSKQIETTIDKINKDIETGALLLKRDD